LPESIHSSAIERPWGFSTASQAMVYSENHLEPGSSISPFVELAGRNSGSVRDHAGKVHRVHLAGRKKFAGQLLPTADRLGNHFEIGHAYAKSASRIHAVFPIDLAGFVAALFFELGKD
jgi:hypothetical protein